MKRIFDFGLSLFLLVILSPVLFSIGLVVRISSSGPIIHWGMRIGRDNKRFKMPKFRTMHLNTPSVATDLLIDPKRWLTPIGSFLRRTSLDELPQLWSIFIGDMSFVGPRPHLVEEVNKYPDHNRQLLLLRPGLTGMAQINGRSSLSFEDEMKHEMFYLKNWSLWLDGVIVLKTMIVVVKGENAS